VQSNRWRMTIAEPSDTLQRVVEDHNTATRTGRQTLPDRLQALVAGADSAERTDIINVATNLARYNGWGSDFVVPIVADIVAKSDDPPVVLYSLRTIMRHDPDRASHLYREKKEIVNRTNSEIVRILEVDLGIRPCYW
jgi:hypothetical protein